MSVETLIVGGGQAGLALSYFLTRQGHPHAVLEQAAQAGNVWRNERWDSFTLVTTTVRSRLPGTEDQPVTDEFLPREKIVAYFEDYVQRFRLPVRFGVRVTAVEPDGSRYRVTTETETLDAANVVIATGLFQYPKLPPFSPNFPPEIVQMHSGQYRNPHSLPPGAVLVVGAGQSGGQIAEELYQSGRKVYLSIGSGVRLPRRYRGVDIVEWLNRVGFFDQTPDKLPSPQAKFAPNPQVSGAHGGHTLNLHQFARDGVTLLGHALDLRDGKLILAGDLRQNLEKIDQAEADFLRLIDSYVEKNGLNLPLDTVPQLRDGYDLPEILELDLSAAGITSVIWAGGYRFDYSLVKLPVVDTDGYPIQRRGVTEYPGLYFLGMHWLYKRKSGLLLGVGDDAAYLASHIVSRVKQA